MDKTGVSRVSSLTHPIQFAQDNTHLDRDIIVDFHLAEKRSNPLVALDSGALMAAFTPTEDECRRIFSRDKITNEFLFIIDCSGSMDEDNKIGLARQAMLLFLKSLPLNCLFKIMRFGSHHENLFDGVTAIYTEDNARRAEQLCSSMRADLGGTELVSFTLLRFDVDAFVSFVVASIAMVDGTSPVFGPFSPDLSSVRWRDFQRRRSTSTVSLDVRSHSDLLVRLGLFAEPCIDQRSRSLDQRSFRLHFSVHLRRLLRG